MTLLRPQGLVPADIFLDGDASHFVSGTGQMLTPPGGSSSPGSTELAYAEYTGVVTISATTEATANTIVTAGAVSADGVAAVVIEFYSEEVLMTAVSTLNLWLYEDGTSIGRIGSCVNPAAANFAVPFLIRRRMIPAAGSRTYSIRGSRITANVNVGGGPGGTGNQFPGYIRVTS